MRVAALALMACALAACGEAQQSADSANATSSALEGPNKTIGPDGAAGLTSALPMDVAAISRAAPHFAVAEVQDQVEGDPFTAITLSEGADEIFRLTPTADRRRVHSVVTRSPQVRGPAADIIGEVRFAVAPPEQVSFCRAETIDGAPGFACSTAPNGQFWRVYKLPEGYTGPSAAFEEIDPDVLHDALLAEMRWIAPRAE
ncbi:MAG TPA: hypothetical protein VEA80_03525 [Vitreimonas sp.]|uniref:hypothetical protein n=1 Tax=Vitreimonas sp. TaxID=3069702 RepID=UPI002D5EF56E|nr:hypothetical protein [Vitreimonas sp.]HYD86519.1 hypothetical protein [Vitreimonas sp.]